MMSMLKLDPFNGQIVQPGMCLTTAVRVGDTCRGRAAREPRVRVTEAEGHRPALRTRRRARGEIRATATRAAASEGSLRGLSHGRPHRGGLGVPSPCGKGRQVQNPGHILPDCLPDVRCEGGHCD